ncbi:MAG: L-glutamine--2-deoxy-scyllo-inosose aminotransferase KanB, partial [Sediminibacterium sp.]
NYALRVYLEQIPEVSFRVIPEGGVDSCSFISWFLPSEEITKAVVAEMKTQGILAGNFYWFINNWHYISKWDHLKEAKTLHNISEEQRTALLKLNGTKFPASDAIMSRCISTAISLVWSEEQIEEKGEKMVAVIKKVLHANLQKV